MDIVPSISEFIKIIIWPSLLIFVILLMANKYETFEKIWTCIWSPITNLKGGLKISLWGQEIQFTPEGFREIANIAKLDMKKYLPNESLLEAIPYVSSEISEEVINKLEVLESFGLRIDEIDDHIILSYVASYQYIKRNYTEALKYYRLAIDKIGNINGDKNNIKTISMINCSIGWTFAALAILDYAIKYFDESIKMENDNPWSYLGKYSIYRGLHDKKGLIIVDNYETIYKESERIFNKRMKNNKLDHMSYCGLATLYFYNKEYKKAIDHFDNAIALSNDLALAYYNRAICKFHLLQSEHPEIFDSDSEIHDGEFEDAMKDLFQAINKNPILREFTIRDPDLKKIIGNKCYRCFITHIPLGADG